MVFKLPKIIPNKHHNSALQKRLAYVAFGCLIGFSPAFAQNVPGPADAARILPSTMPDISVKHVQRTEIPKADIITSAPAGADQIKFKLEDIKLEGVTAFSSAEVAVAYFPYYLETVSLKDVWDIADKITAFYRERGYFLTRAYVPQQEIENGIITINVVEGYIGKVSLDEKIADKRLVRQLIHDITAEKPIKAERLEELVLRLNDLPGYKFRSVLKALKDAPEGATQLVLIPEKDPARGMLGFGNSGSRFLGPYITSLTVQDALIDMQKTTLSVAASTQIDEVKYGTLTHEIPLTPSLSLNMTGSYVQATPGYTLRRNDIQSDSIEWGTGLTYHLIRQWQRNMDFSIVFNSRNTNSTIFDVPLTHDRIRVVRGTVGYDFADEWNAYHSFSSTLSQGVDVLGSSQAGDLNLSRGQAMPHFTKLEARYRQQRYLGQKILMTGLVSGQYADDPLYSSEEFGYGGSGIGRAYDNSEITGDRGIAASLELGYKGFNFPKAVITPFIFYDIGKVWNLDIGQAEQSGSSVGVGIHVVDNNGISIDLTIAQPLTKEIDTPLYGNGKNPRVLLQINSSF